MEPKNTPRPPRLIDANALEDLFRGTIYRIAQEPKITGALEHMVRASAMVIEMINDAPTVEAVPVRHGRWLMNYETEEGRSVRCSQCLMVYWIGRGRDGNYCPNCGAKMTEEEEAQNNGNV